MNNECELKNNEISTKVLNLETWDGSYSHLESIFNKVFPKYTFKMHDIVAPIGSDINYTIELLANEHILVSTSYYQPRIIKTDPYSKHIEEFINYLLECLNNCVYKDSTLVQALINGSFEGWN